MYISEIQKRLMGLLDRHKVTYNRAYGLALYNGANPDEIVDSYHLALWFEGADEGVKHALLSIFDNSNRDTGLRICDICGKFITEGYLLHGLDEYACSRECAIKIFQWNGLDKTCSPKVAEKKLDHALEFEEEDNFWTEWVQG